MLLLPLLPSFLACSAGDDSAKDSTPLGMILKDDGQLYAGVARVDLTPTGFETYTDLNGNHAFDGCVTDPTGTRGGCDEPFDDLNGNGYFDAAWIAGFGNGRAALGVHDPITTTALVLSMNGEYVAIVSMDALGLLENRTRDLRDMLEAQGFDRDRIIVSSTHSHQAPDTVGMWGLDTALITGIYEPFLDSIPEGIFDAVSTAAGEMEPVTPSQGAVLMSEWDPRLDGEPFGGTNPDPRVVGGMDDIRDPLIPGDQVLAVALDGANGRVATIVSASGHPETVGSDNDLLSADYVADTRNWIEGHDGGTALFLSAALGGMQSSSGATIPRLDEQGQAVLDENGQQTWINEESFEFARIWGTLVGQAADAALTDHTAWDQIKVTHSDFLVPVNNPSFKLAFQTGLLDTPDDYVVKDTTCPGWGDPNVFGCVPTGVWMIQLGPVTFGSVPGELMPELFWGVPDEPAMTDASLRATDRRWPQWDPDCADVSWDECRNTDAVGDCDCLHAHAAPYTISDDGGVLPINDMLPGTFKAPIGIANAYCGYIVPQPDFSDYVSIFTDDGDHYEETNSCSRDFAPLVQQGFIELTGG